MHPLFVIIFAPALVVPGLGSLGGATGPVSDGPLSEVPTGGLVGANASVQAEAAGTEIAVSADDTGLFLRASLPGPGVSHPVDDGAEAEASLGGSDAEAEGSSANPVALPSPRETAVPVGLAVLGAAAYAALRWYHVVPGLMPLYSRLSKGEMLDNETRAKLVELIEENPGLSQQELAERVDAGWGNTTYHLQRLEQADFVRSEKQGHHRRFYRTGEVQEDDIEALGVLKNDNANQIARYLIEQPGAKQKDVCEALEISPSLAHKWISRLEEHELVESEREWRSKHYTPDDRLDKLVQAV